MAIKELDILCIGNALVDVFAYAEEQFDENLEISSPAQHIEMEKLRTILSVINRKNSPPAIMVSGGGAANAAKIAGLLGAKVCFTGALANDEFGRLFEKNLSAAGVKLRLHHKTSPTGICLYLTIGGKTQIAASPSAALEMSENDISEQDIKKAKVVVIDGFLLFHRPSLVRHVLHLADQHGTVAALDISSAAIAKKYAAEILDYIRKYSIILFLNEEEAAAFHAAAFQAAAFQAGAFHTGAIQAGTSRKELSPQEEESFRFFQSLTSGKKFPIIAVKLGSRGAVCFAEGTMFRAETCAKTPLESTGAGDAFCAGFLCAWLQGKTLSECAAEGNKTAGVILDVIGTQVDVRAFV